MARCRSTGLLWTAVATSFLTHTLSANSLAIVQIEGGRERIILPYQASLFATQQRLKETGALQKADHVLLVCGERTVPVHTHPGIRVLKFNCTEIDDASRGKGLNWPCMYRIASMRLTQYRRILMLDFDVYVAADVLGVFDHPAPAMVRWESPVAGPYQPNGGVHMLAPSDGLYAAALGWLRKLPVGSAKRRKRLLYNMRTPWGAFNNATAATSPDASLVQAGDSDQHFFFTLYNVLEVSQHGPLHELPYSYNVKHYMLSDKQWSAAMYLTFMSEPKQGFMRIVHFNRDKPWEKTQCGPFQHAFWHAAARAAAEVGAHAPTGLVEYVADGQRHEDARPCKRGAVTKGIHVPTKRLESLPHT
jgi:hypothetical protein